MAKTNFWLVQRVVVLVKCITIIDQHRPRTPYDMPSTNRISSIDMTPPRTTRRRAPTGPLFPFQTHLLPSSNKGTQAIVNVALHRALRLIIFDKYYILSKMPSSAKEGRVTKSKSRSASRSALRKRRREDADREGEYYLLWSQWDFFILF